MNGTTQWYKVVLPSGRVCVNGDERWWESVSPWPKSCTGVSLRRSAQPYFQRTSDSTLVRDVSTFCCWPTVDSFFDNKLNISRHFIGQPTVDTFLFIFSHCVNPAGWALWWVVVPNSSNSSSCWVKNCVSACLNYSYTRVKNAVTRWVRNSEINSDNRVQHWSRDALRKKKNQIK